MIPTSAATKKVLISPLCGYRLRVFSRWVSENWAHLEYSTLGQYIRSARTVPASVEFFFSTLVFKTTTTNYSTAYVSLKNLETHDQLIFILLNTIGLVDNYMQTSAHQCTSDAATPLSMRLIFDTCKYNRHAGKVVKLSEALDRDTCMAILFYALNGCGVYENHFTLDAFLSPPPARFTLTDPSQLFDMLPHFSPDALQLQKDLAWTSAIENFYNITMYCRINDRANYKILRRSSITPPKYALRLECGTVCVNFYCQTSTPKHYTINERTSGRELFSGVNHPNLPCSCFWRDDGKVDNIEIVFDGHVHFNPIRIYPARLVAEPDLPINITPLSDKGFFLLEINKQEHIVPILFTSLLRDGAALTQEEESPIGNLLNVRHDDDDGWMPRTRKSKAIGRL